VSAVKILQNLPENLMSHFTKIVVDLETARQLETQTQLQAECQIWKELHVGRMTASRFGQVIKRKSIPSTSFLKSFASNHDMTKVPPPIACGKENKKVAMNRYSALKDAVVRECGIVINPSCPWLGASPDGIAIGVVGEPTLLEIKCPYAHCSDTVMEACRDPQFCFELQDGQAVLKRSHNYFFQVMGQMTISGTHSCDFILFTKKDISVEMIRFNEKDWLQTEQVLTRFYFTYLLPFLSQ
jgi:hypothetical protein